MSNSSNIQEYVGNKVATIIEEKYLERIEYLEGILNSQKICYNANCGCCGEYTEARQCNPEKRIEHFHCYECFALICFKCDQIYCKLCEEQKERRDFVNSF